MPPAPPETWRDVPAALRAALAAPFAKAAGGEPGLPGLREAGEVLGWRAGPLNEWRGGPRPLTNLLVGAALGSLGGYGAGRLAEQFLPERYFTPGAVRRRGAVLGALLGSVPPALQAADNLAYTGDPASVLAPWPHPLKKDSAWKEAEADLFAPAIPVNAFTAAVWGDPRTPPPLRAATAGLVTAADAVGRNDGYTSPWDVARIAVGAGAGLVSGVVAGKALGLLAGLTPDAQRKVQELGLWAGVLREVVPQALGLRR